VDASSALREQAACEASLRPRQNLLTDKASGGGDWPCSQLEDAIRFLTNRSGLSYDVVDDKTVRIKTKQ
jgi:hypothetical protein